MLGNRDESMTYYVGMEKAKLWEEAKGKLRAMYHVAGGMPSGSNRLPDWAETKECVERFIKSVEDAGLHE